MADAFRLDFNRPAAVLGPVLFCALARLAASCFSVTMKALLLLGGFVGIVIAARTSTLGLPCGACDGRFPGPPDVVKTSKKPRRGKKKIGFVLQKKMFTI